MGLITKLEDLVNKLLTRLGAQIVLLLKRFIPKKIQHYFQRTVTFDYKGHASETAKKGLVKVVESKKLIPVIKTKLSESYKSALDQYKVKGVQKNGKLKTIFMAPVLVVGQWLQGLSTLQSLLLLGFSAASFFAVFGIIFQGQKLAHQHLEADREPASVEVELPGRPGYYKQNRRHFEVTNLRLPVYVAEVNEIRSVDIDFVALVSNRNSRKLLEKFEFQLRDHLTLELEPIIATFPLQEEGKEMIKEKLKAEIEIFMKDRHFEGHIDELKITYILAN